jgi:PAS domain S-box-containing protein
MKGPGSNLGSKFGAAQSVAQGFGRDFFTVLTKWDIRMPALFTNLRILLEVLQWLSLVYSPDWMHEHLIIQESSYFVGFFHFGWWWDKNYANMNLTSLAIVQGIVVATTAASWTLFGAFYRGAASQSLPYLNIPPMVVLRSMSTWLLLPLIHLFMGGWYCSGDAYTVTNFPTESCWSAPHIASVVISVVGLVMLFLTALVLGSLFGEESPTSTHFLARSHHIFDVQSMLSKFVIVILYHIFLDHQNFWPYAILVLLIFVACLISYVVLLPHYHIGAVQLHCGLFFSLVFVASVNIATLSMPKWFQEESIHSFIIVAGLPLAALFGTLIPLFRLNTKFLFFAEEAKKRGKVPRHTAELPFNEGTITGEKRFLPKRYVNIEDEIVQQVRQEEARLSLPEVEQLEEVEIMLPYIDRVRLPTDVELATRTLVILKNAGTHLTPSANMLGFCTRTFLKGLVLFHGSATVSFHFSLFLFHFSRRATLALELLADIITEKNGDVSAIVLFPAFKFATQLRTLFGIKDLSYEQALNRLRGSHKAVLTDTVHFWGKLIDSEGDILGLAGLSSQIARRRIETNQGYVTQILADSAPNRHLLLMYTLFLEHIMLDAPSAVKLKHVADEFAERRKQMLMSSQDPSGGGAKSETSVRTSRNADIEEILLHAGDATGATDELSSGSSDGTTNARLTGFYRSLWISLVLLILTSALIAGANIYLSIYSSWLVDGLYSEGISHAKVHHLSSLLSTCQFQATSCPSMYSSSVTGGSIVLTASSANSGTGATQNSFCDSQSLLLCLQNASNAEVLLRMSHNQVTYGDQGVDNLKGFGTKEFLQYYVERILGVVEPAATNFFVSGGSSPSVYSATTGAKMNDGFSTQMLTTFGAFPIWTLLHRFSALATEAINQLTQVPSTPWSVAVAEIASDLSIPLRELRTAHIEIPERTTIIVQIGVAVCFALGCLVIGSAFFSLEGVLQTVGASKVVVLKLFELIPLPVQRALYVAAKGTLESFEEVSNQKEGEGESLKDGKEDLEADLEDDLPPEDEAGAENGDTNSPALLVPDAFGSNDLPLPGINITNMDSSGLGSLRRKKSDFFDDEERRMSTFIFGATPGEQRTRSVGEDSGHPVKSILKVPGTGAAKKPKGQYVTTRVKFNIPTAVDDKAQTDKTTKLHEPKLKLQAKTSSLVNAFLSDMKKAEEEEAEDRKTAAGLRAAEIEKLMQSGETEYSNAEDTTDPEAIAAGHFRSVTTFFSSTILLASLAAVAIALYATIEPRDALATIQTHLVEDAASWSSVQHMYYQRFDESESFALNGALQHYHQFIKLSTSTDLSQQLQLLGTRTLLGDGSGASVATLVSLVDVITQIQLTAMAIGYRGLGVNPQSVPLLSSFSWPEMSFRDPRALVLDLMQFLDVPGAQVYPSLSSLQNAEIALAAQYAPYLTTVANLSTLPADKLAALQQDTQSMLRNSAWTTLLGDVMKVARTRMEELFSDFFQNFLAKHAEILGAGGSSLTNLGHALFSLDLIMIALTVALIATKVKEFHRQLQTRVSSILPIRTDRVFNPQNALVATVLLIFLGFTVAGAVVARQFVDQTETVLDSSEKFREALTRLNISRTAAADTFFNSERFSVYASESSALELDSALPILADTYDQIAWLLPPEAPSKSQFLVSYQRIFHMYQVAVLLRWSTLNQSTINQVVAGNLLSAYNVQEEETYANDLKAFDLMSTKLQYTNFRSDQLLPVDVRKNMAIFAFSSARPYYYRQQFWTNVKALESAVIASIEARTAQQVETLKQDLTTLIALNAVVLGVVVATVLHPFLAALYGSVDNTAKLLISHLHSGMRVHNSLSAVLLLAVLTLQFAMCSTTLQFPASAADVLSASRERSILTYQTAAITQQLFQQANDSDVLQLVVTQRKLGDILSDLTLARAAVLSVGRGASFGKFDPNTDTQQSISFNGPLATNTLMQRWNDQLVALASAVDDMVVSPTAPPDSSWTWTPITAVTKLSSSSRSTILAFRPTVASLLPLLDDSLQRSTLQCRDDARAASSRMLMVPAIVLGLSMIIMAIFLTLTIFLPMMDTLVLEERGTTSLLGMIPPEVRPFVPKITQYLETGSLVQAEADAKAFPKEATIEKFCQQWVSGVSDAVCFQTLDELEHCATLIDSKGTFLYANEHFYSLFGYTAEDILGQNVRMLMNEPLRSMHDSFLERYVTQGTSRLVGTGRDIPVLCHDGSLMHCYLNLVEATKETGAVYFLGHLQRYNESAAKRVEATM